VTFPHERASWQRRRLEVDSHIDTVQRVLVMGEDLAKRWDVDHVDIPRLHEGGTHAPFFAPWVPVYFPGSEAVRRTPDLRDAMQSLFDTHKDQIEHATTAADIERIVKTGKIAAFLTVEGGHTIDDDLRVLRMYYQLGIRSMTLTHSRNNNWVDSSTDEPAHNGLTDFGKEVVREMNRLGMIVDVSLEGTLFSQPLMGGYANVDDDVSEVPGGTYRGVAPRSFDAKLGQWSIWWMDSRMPRAPMDPPVRGSFQNGVGTFYADDTENGKPIRIRFIWSQITPTSCHWEQAYSPDGGKTWETNWIQDLKRVQ